ncbi:MAG: ATP-binding protein [Bryobacteraceae bacterium]
MSRRWPNDPYDEQPLPQLRADELDVKAAAEAYGRKMTAETLRTLQLTTRYQGQTVPTIGGVLLFGKERLNHFPDSWIHAGRFRGSDKSRIIDSQEIKGRLLRMPFDAESFARKHLFKETVIDAITNRDEWTVPFVALREALINAVVHADYAEAGGPIRLAIFDDRIEVENPGILPLGLTVEEIRRGLSKLRNRVIGRAFHHLKLIEQWGSGIQRMNNACEAAGLPPPVFEELGNRFRVTFATSREAPLRVDAKERAILKALNDGRGRSTAQIAKAVALSPRATRSRLADLVERGLVTERGSGPNDPRKLYYRTG